jgi:medium-chain acyl-[acyl-carrier-protein] hydrolase
MNNYFDKQFQLRYFEMNKFGEASSTTLLTLLEETAADHCESINQGLYTLQNQNIGWVLLSGILVMDRYPKYKEKITIRTWMAEYSMIKGHRENLIFDEKMNVIGRSKGLWVFFDIEKRRPTPIFESIKEEWSNNSELCLDHDISQKILPIGINKDSKEFSVNMFDVDVYHHVNNIKYLQWLIESVSDDIFDNYYLYSIDGRFISESKYGDTIISSSQPEADPNTFIHTICTQKDAKPCATARTIWKKRTN